MKINYIDIEGLNLRDDNFYLTPIGLFEGDKDVIMNDLFTDGTSYNRAKIKERKIILKGYVKGNILSNLFLLKKYLFKPGLKKLTVQIDGMETFYCMVDLLNWASDELYPHVISCQLVAPDPFLYSLGSDSVSLGATSNASLALPVTLPFTLGDITGASGTITNSGNAVAYPIISVVGTCDTITITNATTNESMSLNVSLTDTDTLVIDNTPSNRGIYLNNAKRMDLKNGDWFTCPAGDNIFTFSRNSLQTKQHCSISCQSRWM